MGASASACDIVPCGWRGSNPAPGTNGDDRPLGSGQPGCQRGTGWCRGGMAERRRGELRGGWGDMALGVTRLRGCIVGSPPFALGLAAWVPPGPRGVRWRAQPPGTGLSMGLPGRGSRGAVWLGSARLTYPHPLLIWRFFQRYGEPDAPRRAARGREQRDRGNLAVPGARKSCRLLHPGETPLLHPPNSPPEKLPRLLNPHGCNALGFPPT